MLATPDDLRNLLGEDSDSLPDAEVELLLQLATGAVQAAAGQELVEATSTIEIVGTVDSWLPLPQQPVTSVEGVALDDAEIADYKRFGARLWRAAGWAFSPYVPATVKVTYTHGYPEGAPALALARSAVLALAAQMYSNPTGATGLSIDDYREQYSQSAASDLTGLVPANLVRALRRQYGARGRLVKVG